MVEKNAVIGDGCKLSSRVVVKEGTVLGSDNEIAEGATLGGRAQHLANNGSGVFALTLSGAVDNGGAISVTGTSTGVTTLSGNIGSAVSSITQNSSGILTLSGTNSAFAGPINLVAGTLRVNSAT